MDWLIRLIPFLSRYPPLVKAYASFTLLVIFVLIILLLVYYPGPPQPEALKPSITQTMINSPGGIQAGGNVIIGAERHVIRSIEIRISVETETAATTPQPPAMDVGLGSVIALFTKDKARIRFISNYQVNDHQVSPTRRKLSFVYSPEIPGEILGHDIEFLGSINVLAVNYAEVFRAENFSTQASTTIVMLVILNGVPVAEITGIVPEGLLEKGQAAWDEIGEAFAQIPERYRRAISPTR